MLPLKRILQPTDFSEPSDYAFRLACSLARDYGACLTVLHVVLPPLGSAEVEAHRHPESYFAGIWKELRRYQSPAENVSLEHRLEQGDPAREILRVAQEIGADLIVLGTHGRRGVARALLGSVAEQVVRRASCSVLTVKVPVPQLQPASVLAQETPDKTVEATQDRFGQ